MTSGSIIRFMSSIHIATGGGKPALYDEAQIRGMWKQGLLRPDTVYWIEGMGAWRPLKELIERDDTQPPKVPDALPPPLNLLSLKFVEDPTGVTSTLQVLVSFQLVIGFLVFLGDCGVFVEPKTGTNSFALLVEVVYWAFFVASAIAFLKWVYQANLNCRGFGAQGMRYTPGWSVVYYFIPFLNLFRPYQAMKEIWQVSTNPSDWKTQNDASLVNWWWALWLISGFVSFIMLKISGDPYSPLLHAPIAVVMSASFILDSALCVVALQLVTAIVEKQKQFVKTGAL